MTLDADRLARIALDAGTIIMNVYNSDFKASKKADHSPVTAADQDAETLILTALRKADPALGLIAEEDVSNGRVDVAQLQKAKRYALIDPLDGTKEFVNRNGEFTVNIAIISAGRPVMSVVYAPALERLFVQPSRHEAWTARVAPGAAVPEARTRLRVRKAPASGLVAFASKSHASPETKAWLEDYPIAECRTAGSSLKFCLIAAGEADLYPRHGPTCHWDTAAGHGVLEAAGGRVMQLDGAPLLYAPDVPGFLNPYFAAFGDVSPVKR